MSGIVPSRMRLELLDGSVLKVISNSASSQVWLPLKKCGRTKENGTGGGLFESEIRF